MEVEIFFYRVDLFPPVLFEQLQRSQYRKSKSSVNLIPWILTSRSKILNISCKECIADLTWSTKVILICSPFENSMVFFLVKTLNLTLIHLVIPFKGRLIIRYYIMLLVMELIIANNCFPCSSPEPWGYPSFFFFFYISSPLKSLSKFQPKLTRIILDKPSKSSNMTVVNINR